MFRAAPGIGGNRQFPAGPLTYSYLAKANVTAQHRCHARTRGRVSNQGSIFPMSLPIFVLAAAAAAQPAAHRPAVDPAQAQAAGYAQAQAALGGQSGQGAVIAPAAPQAVIVQPAGGTMLRAGTEIPLRMEEGLDSNDKTIREGQQFHLTVASDVVLGNMVVIRAGSQAMGEISDLRRNGMWGKSGHSSARALNVRVGDRLIRLTGNFDEHGTTGTVDVGAA